MNFVISCGDFDTIHFGKLPMDAVDQGRLPQTVFDEQGSRILGNAYKTGVFDCRDPKEGAQIKRPFQQVALRAAQQNVVLLNAVGVPSRGGPLRSGGCGEAPSLCCFSLPASVLSEKLYYLSLSYRIL